MISIISRYSDTLLRVLHIFEWLRRSRNFLALTVFVCQKYLADVRLALLSYQLNCYDFGEGSAYL